MNHALARCTRVPRNTDVHVVHKDALKEITMTNEEHWDQLMWFLDNRCRQTTGQLDGETLVAQCIVKGRMPEADSEDRRLKFSHGGPNGIYGFEWKIEIEGLETGEKLVHEYHQSKGFAADGTPKPYNSLPLSVEEVIVDMLIFGDWQG